jgi:hypothetical protein
MRKPTKAHVTELVERGGRRECKLSRDRVKMLEKQGDLESKANDTNYIHRQS